MKTLETHALSLQRDGLRVHVVAAGVLYGDGEQALAPVFKQAWLTETDTVTVPAADGVGGNHLPMIHVRDLAGTVAATAREEGLDTPYLLAVDEGRQTLAQATLAVARTMSLGRVYFPPRPEAEALVLASKALAELQVNLRLDVADATPLSLPFDWHAREGFRANAASLAAEYAAARRLEPVRIVVTGPPLSGKSTLAAALAAEYCVPVITPLQAVQALASDPPQLAGSDSAQPPPGTVQVAGQAADEAEEGGAGKEADAEDGKEAEVEEEEEEEEEEPSAFQRAEEALREVVRAALTSSGAASGGGGTWSVSHAAALALPRKLLARAVRHEAMRPEARNRGWVLDGFPTSVEEARILFGELDDEAEDFEELAEEEGGGAGGRARGKKGRVPLEDEEDDEEQVPIELDSRMAPRAVLGVAVDDTTLEARCAAVPVDTIIPGYNDADGLATRTEEFHAHNKDDGARSLVVFFENSAALEIVPVSGQAQTAALALAPALPVIDGTSRPYNFHPTPAELATKALALEEEEVRAAARAAAAAQTLESDEQRELQARDAERAKRLAAVAAHERDLLELRTVPLRSYLVSTVVPTLTEGLAEVCKVAPADPIAHLAEYLYRASQSEGEAATAM